MGGRLGREGFGSSLGDARRRGGYKDGSNVFLCDRPAARASATNPATATSSARIVGSSPAAASSAARSSPRAAAKAFSDWRSILRRWPKRPGSSAESTPASQGSGARAGNEFDHARSDLGRRREGGGRNVEQDARLRPPAGQHGEPAIIGALGRRRDDAPRHLALEHQHQPIVEGRPGLGLEPAGQQRGGDVVGQVGDDADRQGPGLVDQRPRRDAQRVAVDDVEPSRPMRGDLGKRGERARRRARSR